MTLDIDGEFIMKIDERRSLSLIPTEDGATACLSLEDPHSVTVVELTMAEIDVLIEALQRLRP
jgi:hypothetical protein